MRFRTRFSIQKVTTWVTLVALTGQLFITPAAIAGKRWYHTSTTVDELAKSIDKLQKHVDEYGTVVAKTPDVWGESRLLRHRDQFETEMSKDLVNFQQVLSASQSTRDGAFLASALSLQNAISNRQTVTENGKVTENVTPAALQMQVTNLLPEQTTAGEPGVTLTPGNFNFGSPTFGSEFRQSTPKDAKLILSTEPEIYLDQKKRYLDHLNQIRRLNEGDDNADSPGYALNLVRIPVSVLPGKKTRIGHGAEVNVTVEPVLGDDLLPTTFRDFVINDVVDRLAPRVTRFVNSSAKDREKLEKSWNEYRGAIVKRLVVMNVDPAKWPASLKKEYIEKQQQTTYASPVDIEASNVDAEFESLLSALNNNSEYGTTESSPPKSDLDKFKEESLTNIDVKTEDLDESIREIGTFLSSEISAVAPTSSPRRPELSTPESHQLGINGTSLALIMLTTAKFLRGKSDTDKIVHFADVKSFLRDELVGSYKFLSQPEVQPMWERHCTPELAAAILEHRRSIKDDRDAANKKEDDSLNYAFLAKNQSNSVKRESISYYRKMFFEDLTKFHPETNFTMTGYLAWHIFVESTLLNERLVEDMQLLATSKNAHNLCTYWQAYYGPNPGPEARAAFNDYVRCRWPVHVFALDPVTQDQNVGTSFSRRRELQLVLALAAANRMITAQSLTRFVRRLEYDLETIELNRTAIGFSHGNQDFGWRFYPRVQQPRVPGNLSAITHDLLIGGQSQDSLQKDRMLEPGIRECTALVVMPSFVPYMMVDVRTNYFSLTCDTLHLRPALKRSLDVSDAVKLSEEITEMRRLACKCVEDEHLYREGEVHRLIKTVGQLDAQMPLQTEYVQIPYENTAGGFEIFNSGITSLAPELIDWYGAPGIVVSENPRPISRQYTTKFEADGKASVTLLEPHPNDTTGAIAGTSLFLIGKNFTSLGDGTRVIAGGVDVTASRHLISREIMQVTIPQTAAAETHDGKKFVDIHIATPYGVTRHVLVEAIVVNNTTEAETKKVVEAAVKAHVQQKHVDNFTWSDKAVTACIELNNDATIKKLVLQEETQIIDNVKPGVFDDSKWTTYEQLYGADLGVRVYVKAKADKAYQTDPIATVPMPKGHFVLGKDGKPYWFSDVNSPPEHQMKPLLEKLLGIMKCKPVPKDIEKIKLVAFLRLSANDHHQAGVFSVEDALEITLSPCKEEKCCLPNCDQTDLFGAPCLQTSPSNETLMDNQAPTNNPQPTTAAPATTSATSNINLETEPQQQRPDLLAPQGNFLSPPRAMLR